MIFENNNFFDYCKTALHKNFFTVSENNHVKIKESKDDAKLKEVKVYFDKECYRVLQITFDINNLEFHRKFGDCLRKSFSENKLSSIGTEFLYESELKDFFPELFDIKI